jgi:hypothetical protein
MGPSHAVAKGRYALLLAAITFAVLPRANAEDRMDFNPVREANVRLTSGASVKGQLKSIAADQVIVIMTKDDSEKVIPMANVRVISTNDKSFTYSPAQESFDKLIERPRLQGVTIQRGVGSTASGDNANGDDARSSASKSPNNPPEVFAQFSGLGGKSKAGPLSSTGGFAAQDGFAGQSVRPGKKPKLDTSALASIVGAPSSASGEPSSSGASATKTPGKLIGKPGETIYCSNPKCKKQVTDARYGDKCPHCGVLWLQQSTTDLIASSGSSAAGGTSNPANPFGDGGGAAAAGGNLAGNAAASPTVVTSGGFSIESVPWWGKLVGFGGLIAVLWFVSQRR